jgi:hypothetical protein
LMILGSRSIPATAAFVVVLFVIHMAIAFSKVRGEEAE